MISPQDLELGLTPLYIKLQKKEGMTSLQMLDGFGRVGPGWGGYLLYFVVFCCSQH